MLTRPTPDEVDDLPAGRTFDALLHEFLFGQTVVFPHGDPERPWAPDPTTQSGLREVPRYTTTDHQQVLDWLTALPPQGDCHLEHVGCRGENPHEAWDDHSWCCGRFCFDEDPTQWGYGDTQGEAIGRAALKLALRLREGDPLVPL